MIGILSIHLRLPGCASLKEKRGRLKPLLNQLHKKFNVSVAAMNLTNEPYFVHGSVVPGVGVSAVTGLEVLVK